MLVAALALPGVVPAHAQSAPDKGIFQLQYLNYRDWQPGKNRMTVEAPAFYALLPISDTLVVEGGMVYDAMSGASPLIFNTLSGASIFDYRTAGDLKVTKYFDGYAVSFGGFVSSEQDFLSRGGSVNVQIYSDDRNRTWTLGMAGTNDRINPTNQLVVDAPRNSVEFLVGVTQALTANSIIQSNFTFYTGHGYFSDPYKTLDTPADEPPDIRVADTVQPVLPRSGRDAQARVSLVVRLVRQHDQHGRGVVGAGVAVRVCRHPGPCATTRRTRRISTTTRRGRRATAAKAPSTRPIRRLAAFGAITAGVIVSKTVWDGWNVSLRADYYRQDPDWRLGGSGSPGIQTFSARWLEVNFTKNF